MSGTLGKALIQPNESCKVYTNSSGNAASITIHNQVLSTSDNSEISIKTSATDACTQCSTNLDTTNVEPNVTSQIVENCSGTYCGFTLTQVIDTDDLSSSFCDRTNSVTYTTLPSAGTCKSCWCSFGDLRPAKDSDFGSGIQCCPFMNFFSSGMIAQNQRNYPSFVEGSGENPAIVVDCTNRSGAIAQNNVYYYNLPAACCCLDFNDDRYCKIRHYHCGHTCVNSCCPCCWVRCVGQAMISVQDIWSDSNPIFQIECLCGPGSCQFFSASAQNNSCQERSNYGGNRCSAAYAFNNHVRSEYRECCYCCGCYCCDQWQQNTHDSHKYIMAGCRVAFNAGMGNGNGQTEIIVYSDGSGACDCCLSGDIATQMSRYTGRDQCNLACEVYAPVLACISSPSIKWLWYNPYVKCNYFEIMTSDNPYATSGIYSIDPSYSPNGADCLYGSCYNNCNFQCYKVEEWIAFGSIKCISGTPSAWAEKTSKYEVSSNPRLISPCCWAIWKQCFTWGQVPAEGGWNGCMIQYRSNDLISWTKVSDQVSQVSNVGSGNAVCTTSLKNDGSDFTSNTNYYFNSANCVDDTGTLEYKVDANRLERTGIVISNNDKVYVNNKGSVPVSVQVWGYDE